MSVVIALVRKNLLDSRWLLLICGLSLFGLCWMSVWGAHRTEVALQNGGGNRGMGMLRGLGGSSMDFSSAAIEMAFWNHPFVLLLFAIWAISRGSGAVAGEIEKGTMDLVLSRPVGRSSFLASQLILSLAGMALLAGAMMAGTLAGSRYYTLIAPASAASMTRPAINLVALGWAIFGYTFLLSTLDIARWRPNLIGSVATLAGWVALIFARSPQYDLEWLEKFSIFRAYDPVEAVLKGENLAFNAGLLGIIGLVGVVLGFVIFARRDLPAGS